MADASIKVLGGKINADGTRQVSILIDGHVEKSVQVPASIVLPNDLMKYLREHADHARNDQFYKTLEGLKFVDVQTGSSLQPRSEVPAEDQARVAAHAAAQKSSGA